MRLREVILALTLAALPTAGWADDKRGAYLAVIMDCGGCHTPGALLGKPDPARALSGSDVGFEIPGLGIFFPPNLTSDDATGLGRWSRADIVRAVTTGERPDGRILVPVMPWHSYARLTAEDADALAGYLKSLAPIANKTPAIAGPGTRPDGLYLTVVKP